MEDLRELEREGRWRWRTRIRTLTPSVSFESRHLALVPALKTPATPLICPPMGAKSDHRKFGRRRYGLFLLLAKV